MFNGTLEGVRSCGSLRVLSEFNLSWVFFVDMSTPFKYKQSNRVTTSCTPGGRFLFLRCISPVIRPLASCFPLIKSSSSPSATRVLQGSCFTFSTILLLIFAVRLLPKSDQTRTSLPSFATCT